MTKRKTDEHLPLKRTTYLNLLRSEASGQLIVSNIYGFSSRAWADEYATPQRVGCIKVVLEERYDD